MHTKAPAIVEEATSGSEITVNDSADGMRLQKLNVYGKSWQVSTTGSNLFKITKTSETLKGITFDVRKDGTIKVSGTNTESSALYVILGTFEVVAGQTYIFNNFYSLENGDVETYIQIKNDIVLSKINAVEKDMYMYTAKETGVLNVSFKIRAGVTVDTTLSKMQINVGETVLPWEPYTGGKPSPSPDYPQEIQSAGYVLSTGKNLLNADEYYSEFKQSDGTYKGNVVNINNVRISLSKFVRKKVTLSVKVKVATTTSSVYIAAYIGSEQKRINGSMITSGLTGKSILTVTPALNTDYFIISYGSGNDDVTFSELQLELGSVDTSYEPYTGGVPALYQKDIEVGVIGKNLFGGKAFADKIVELGGNLNEINKTVTILASVISHKIVYEFPDKTKQYTIMLSGYNIAEEQNTNLSIVYEDGTRVNFLFENGKLLFVTNKNKKPKKIVGSYYTKTSIFNYEQCGIFEGVLTETDFKPYKYQSLPITNPTGLPAIPVPSGTSGITYTDADGQAWIADEIDFERGKYIQRVWQAEFDGSEDEEYSYYGTLDDRYGFYLKTITLPSVMNLRMGFSNEYIVSQKNEARDNIIWFGANNKIVYFIKNKFRDDSLEDKGLSNFKAHLAANPLKVITYLDTPIETDLSEEQIQSYKAIHTNKPTTIVSNDANAWMGASYAADTKIWIENKIKEIVTS